MTVMPPELRIAVTVAFAAAGLFCLHRCVGVARWRGAADRVGYGAHALMSGSMVAMVWSQPRLVGWQMTVFALACGWFAVQATGVSTASLRLATSGPASAGPAMHGGHGGGRGRCLHHAIVMAAMVWMFTAMAPRAMSMPGMTKDRPSALVAVIGGGYCLIVAGLLLVGYVIAIVRGGRARDESARDDLVHAVMTAGAGAMLFAVG